MTVPGGAGAVAFVAVDKRSPDLMSTQFLIPVYDDITNTVYRDAQYGSTQNDSIERLLFGLGYVQPISVDHIRKLAEATRNGDEKFIVNFLHHYSDHVSQ